MGYVELIREATDLDSLFELWEKKAPSSEKYIVEGIEHNIEINHAANKFIPDGIVIAVSDSHP